jgi:biotin operon repressor
MSKQQTSVLAALRKYGSMSDSQLALVTGQPQASCRRTVQSLRAQGYNITFMQDSREGSAGYTLQEGQ